eukprot:sb/3474228/
MEMATSLRPSLSDIQLCPSDISSIFFMCDATIEVAVTGSNPGSSSYTAGLIINNVFDPFKYNSELWTLQPVTDDAGGWKPETPPQRAYSTPVFPATGVVNHRLCNYYSFTVQNFGGGCGFQVNGDYSSSTFNTPVRAFFT